MSYARAFVCFCLCSMTSCVTLSRSPTPPAPEDLDRLSAETMNVVEFTCDDPTIAEAVRNVFMGELSHQGFLVVEDDDADIVITGTITTTVDHSVSGKSGAFAWGTAAGAEQKFSSVAGKYVSGVSCLARFRGHLIAHGAYSQTRSSGAYYRAPEAMAESAVRDLMWELANARRKGKVWY